MKVFDGALEIDNALLGTFCDQNRPTTDVLASFNEMTITFETDDVTEGSGFRMAYHAKTFLSTFVTQSSSGKYQDNY